jgi:hypothetical protein
LPKRYVPLLMPISSSSVGLNSGIERRDRTSWTKTKPRMTVQSTIWKRWMLTPLASERMSMSKRWLLHPSAVGKRRLMSAMRAL